MKQFPGNKGFNSKLIFLHSLADIRRLMGKENQYFDVNENFYKLFTWYSESVSIQELAFIASQLTVKCI